VRSFRQDDGLTKRVIRNILAPTWRVGKQETPREGNPRQNRKSAQRHHPQGNVIVGEETCSIPNSSSKPRAISDLSGSYDAIDQNASASGFTPDHLYGKVHKTTYGTP
jgi:hypothetical protein